MILDQIPEKGKRIVARLLTDRGIPIREGEVGDIMITSQIREIILTPPNV